MEVRIKRDTPEKIVVTTFTEYLAVRQRVRHFRVIAYKSRVNVSGFEMRPE